MTGEELAGYLQEQMINYSHKANIPNMAKSTIPAKNFAPNAWGDSIICMVMCGDGLKIGIVTITMVMSPKK
ncbi:MAG: hypothetical protein PVI90_12455 [Desulfobacteraceae bacterium]